MSQKAVQKSYLKIKKHKVHNLRGTLEHWSSKQMNLKRSIKQKKKKICQHFAIELRANFQNYRDKREKENLKKLTS